MRCSRNGSKKIASPGANTGDVLWRLIEAYGLVTAERRDALRAVVAPKLRSWVSGASGG